MKYQETEFFQAWAKFLHPESLKSNLIMGALFLVTYETLRDSIIDRLKDFYCFGFNEGEWQQSQEYREDVLSRHKSPLNASLLWLKESNVVDQADLDFVNRVIEHRRQVAHELLKFLATAKSEFDLEMLRDMVKLIAKVDRWWIREVEIPTNPDFDDQDMSVIPDEEIQSGNLMTLQWMFEIVSGDDQRSMAFYNELLKLADKEVSPFPFRRTYST